MALFRHTPWIFDELFNRPALLSKLSRFASSTNAKDLGALTLSVLQGEDGHQRKELEKLTKWLKDAYRPNLVQLTNSMFVGFAKQMKKALDVPILCALQGEDIFLEGLVEPYKSQALEVLHARVSDVDGFIAPCQYYAEFMASYLEIPADKVEVVKLGLNLEGHGKARETAISDSPFVIGYLARICPEGTAGICLSMRLPVDATGRI